ncbi:MAG: polysialyltransferase family glycosyltransferase [Actinomycetota bacterium]
MPVEGAPSACGARHSWTDVAVVSNLGQARNAVALAESRPSQRFLVVVATTPSTTDLGFRLARYCETEGLAAVLLSLPKRPLAPRPLAMRRMVAAFGQLARRARPTRVWVANANAHYAVLADVMAAQGVVVNYFEEGLGTYRAWAASSNGPTEARRRLRQEFRVAANEHLSWLSAGPSSWSLWRLRAAVRNLAPIAVDLTTRLLSTWSWYRHLIDTASSGHGRAFFDVHREFDTAVVARPELLDRVWFTARFVERLDVIPSERERMAALQAVDLIGAPSGSTLLVTQPYVDRGPIYYAALASTLAQCGVSEVVVKPHPRERDYSRFHLSKQLSASGIAAHALADPDALTAESLLSTGRFTSCFAVTSSTLLYGPESSPEVHYVALGGAVLEALNRARVDPARLQVLRDDWAIARRLDGVSIIGHS